MITLFVGLIAAFIGGRIAYRRGGNRADIAQYAFGFGIAFFLAVYLIFLIINNFT